MEPIFSSARIVFLATALPLFFSSLLVAESADTEAAKEAQAPQPEFWSPYGGAEFEWSAGTARSGRYSVSVANSTGELAGWAQMFPVRSDRIYQFETWVNTAARNAVAAIQFLDADREPIGSLTTSALPSQQNQWVAVQTPKVSPPEGAYFARLVVGFSGPEKGRALFDDAKLTIEPVPGAPLPNLVPNGNFETIKDNALPGWKDAVMRAETKPGEGASINGVKTDEGHALRTAVDRRGHPEGEEPKNMGATTSTVDHIPVLAGADYEIQFRHKSAVERGDLGSQANVRYHISVDFKGKVVEDRHISNQLIGGIRENMEPGDGETWKTMEMNFQAAPGVERCYLNFGAGTWISYSHLAWMLVDDVQMVPLDYELKNADFEQSASIPRVVATREQVTEFLGNKQARMLIHYPADVSPPKGGVVGPIYYIDLHKDPLELVLLVDDAEGGLIGDPFLSPDGTRAAYKNGKGTYVVRVTPGGADRTLVAENAYDQRWWVHPTTGDEYIIYVDTPMGSEDSIAGTTFIQQIERGGCKPIGAPKVLIADYAFRGGRSPCGRYICTALPGRAFAELNPEATENALVDILYSDRRMCNASISQDPEHPTRWLWLVEAHDAIQINDADKTVGGLRAPSGHQYRSIQWGEWSTHPDFLSASPSTLNDDATPRIHDAWIYQFSTQKWLQVTKRAGTTHLWVAKDDSAALPATPASATPQPDATEQSTAAPAPQESKAEEVTLWPASQENLLFAWRDGEKPPLVRNAAGEPVFRTFWQPEALGLALLDGHFNLRLEGGSFIGKELAEPIAQAIQKSGALTLQLVIYPSDIPAAGPLPILQFGEAGKTAPLALVEQAGQLELWSDFPHLQGEGLRSKLLPLEAGNPLCLAIVMEGKQVHIYANGKLIRRSGWLDLDLAQWPAASLLIGSGAADNGWRGKLSHIALHSVALPADTIAAFADEVQAELRERPPIPQALVEAKLVEVSKTPTPDETSYSRGYSVYAYELVNVLSGEFPDKQFRVAHWSEMGDQALAPANYEAGQVFQLVLEPFESHPELEREQVFDTLPQDFEIPMFYDAGPIKK